MTHERDKPSKMQGDSVDPNAAGKTAGSSTQSQGGIGHEVAERARADYDPATGLPSGPLGARAAPLRESLDDGGGGAPHDGRARHGFSGDDGEHEPVSRTGTPASLQPGPLADLGAQQDQRLHGMPRDPAERTTGADTPNQGGIAGSPGHPSPSSPMRFPGEDPSDGVTGGGGRLHDDEQREPEI